jgi:cation transport protein ChaC
MTMWVFGYGSLLWNPGFAVAEKVVATLPGYARSFCMWSIHHRGTEEQPGLVLALDEEPSHVCEGVALAVRSGDEETTLAYLRARELISSAYIERWLAVDLFDGRRVDALAYVINPGHVQYCGGMPLEQQAQVIARARGGMGPNPEYLYNTVAHLEEIGLHDPDLEWLSHRVRSLAP